mgnify:CR=1 FL=1
MPEGDRQRRAVGASREVGVLMEKTHEENICRFGYSIRLIGAYECFPKEGPPGLRTRIDIFFPDDHIAVTVSFDDGMDLRTKKQRVATALANLSEYIIKKEVSP